MPADLIVVVAPAATEAAVDDKAPITLPECRRECLRITSAKHNYVVRIDISNRTFKEGDSTGMFFNYPDAF